MQKLDVVAIKDIPVCALSKVPVDTCGTIYRLDEDSSNLAYVRFESGQDIIVKLGEDVRPYD
jgi:hypothetical protein